MLTLVESAARSSVLTWLRNASVTVTFFDGPTLNVTTVLNGKNGERAQHGTSTRTSALPPFASNAAGMAAVSWWPFTRVVLSGAPFQRTCAPVTKPTPSTVSVSGPSPGFAEVGETLVTLTEFCSTTAVAVFEDRPPAVAIDTRAVPLSSVNPGSGVNSSAPGPLKVVACGFPFQYTTESGGKKAPVTSTLVEPMSTVRGPLMIAKEFRSATLPTKGT